MNTQQKYAQTERKSKNYAQLAVAPANEPLVAAVAATVTDGGNLNIKAYFEQVRKLYKSGEPFPVCLDEVWPLAYKQKTKAVEMLQRNFIESVDFKVFSQKGKNPKGGRPEQKYKISVMCMEWLIVRKVPAVFDVYRTVFHWVADIMENDGLTKEVKSLRAEIKALRIEQSRLNEIVKARVDNPVIPPAHELKAKILGNIKALADASYASTFVSIMNNFMYDMEHHYCVNIGKATRYVGEGPLDVYIRLGYSAQLEELADFKYSPVKK